MNVTSKSMMRLIRLIQYFMFYISIVITIEAAVYWGILPLAICYLINLFLPEEYRIGISENTQALFIRPKNPLIEMFVALTTWTLFAILTIDLL